MRRFVASALVLLALAPGAARAGSVGLGLFTGLTYPVLQDDTGQGTLMGVRIPVKAIPLLNVEPYYGSSGLADKDLSVAGSTYTREGFDETLYGVDVSLGSGGPLSFYPFAGLGKATLERTGDRRVLTTWNAGFGMCIAPMPKLNIDVRAEFQTSLDGEASRKFGTATVGVSYALLTR